MAELPPTVAGGPTPNLPPEVPEFAGRYRLLEEIGRGGMGVVVRAQDEELGRPLAIKLLLPRHDPAGSVGRRFLDEARLTAQLQHPGIPAVHEVGALPNGRPWFAMKLVEGQDLAALILSTHARLELLPAFESLCQTIAYAHSRGVIHRDLKPANVMVGAFGEVQVMDWGLAKRVGRDAPGQPAPQGPATANGSLTQDGAALGTPAYMPPEQAKGDVGAMDERSDVFALGGILCAILTGEPPFLGPSEDALRKSACGDLTEALARLEAVKEEKELARLAANCLVVEQARRPLNAGAVATAFGKIQAEKARERQQGWVRSQIAGVMLSLFGMVLLVLAYVSVTRAIQTESSTGGSRQAFHNSHSEVSELRRDLAPLVRELKDALGIGGPQRRRLPPATGGGLLVTGPMMPKQGSQMARLLDRAGSLAPKAIKAAREGNDERLQDAMLQAALQRLEGLKPDQTQEVEKRIAAAAAALDAAAEAGTKAFRGRTRKKRQQLRAAALAALGPLGLIGPGDAAGPPGMPYAD